MRAPPSFSSSGQPGTVLTMVTDGSNHPSTSANQNTVVTVKYSGHWQGSRLPISPGLQLIRTPRGFPAANHPSTSANQNTMVTTVTVGSQPPITLALQPIKTPQLVFCAKAWRVAKMFFSQNKGVKDCSIPNKTSTISICNVTHSPMRRQPREMVWNWGETLTAVNEVNYKRNGVETRRNISCSQWGKLQSSEWRIRLKPLCIPPVNTIPHRQWKAYEERGGALSSVKSPL